MGLFDLIEQHNLIGPAPHCFGQHTAFVIADIARRGTDQTGHRVFLHELGHVDAHHRVVVVEQEIRHGLGQLGLTHAGRAEEQERAQRAAFVIQARTRTTHGVGNGGDGGILTDHAGVQIIFHPQQLLALTFQHFRGRNTGPAFNNASDLFRAYRFLGHHGVAFGVFGLSQLFLKLGDDAVRQLTRLGEVAFTLGDLQIGPRLVELFFQIARTSQLVAFGLPLGGHLGGFLLQVGQILLQGFQTILRCRVIL